MHVTRYYNIKFNCKNIKNSATDGETKAESKRKGKKHHRIGKRKPRISKIKCTGKRQSNSTDIWE